MDHILKWITTLFFGMKNIKYLSPFYFRMWNLAMFDWSIDGMCQTLLKLYILDTRIDESPPPLDPQVTALGIIIIENVDVRPPSYI
jgi:hypothetical protein